MKTKLSAALVILGLAQAAAGQPVDAAVEAPSAVDPAVAAPSAVDPAVAAPSAVDPAVAAPSATSAPVVVAPAAPARAAVKEPVEVVPIPQTPVESLFQGDVASLRQSSRAGMHFYWDESHKAVDEDPYRVHGDISLDLRLAGPLWLGAAYSGGSTKGGKVYQDVETETRTDMVRVHAMYRRNLAPWFAAYGRLGPTVTWYSLDYTLEGNPTLSMNDWALGLNAAVGLDLLLLHPSIISEFTEVSRDFGIGLNLEVFHDQVMPINLTQGGVDAGELNLSGTGWLLGLIFQL